MTDDHDEIDEGLVALCAHYRMVTKSLREALEDASAEVRRLQMENAAQRIEVERLRKLAGDRP